ncbi:MAG: AAA family ATPase [Gammaproteobacteria bacterium]|jgi:energy-coupling factor transporter ATP-binding protein EcfA2
MPDSADLRQLQRELSERLQHGEHVVLCGPLGSGKSTLLAKLQKRIAATGTPCALWTATSSLDDITRAFAQAYPHVNTEATRRGARSRLWLAADQRRGVLIFDHVTRITNAMVGYLRRLRGGVAGVLLSFDVEKESRRLEIRSRQLHHTFLRMPLVSLQQLRRQFHRGCAGHSIPGVSRSDEHQIIQAARGRVGYIACCTRLIAHERYWTGGLLHPALLCFDAEIALRQRVLDFPLTEHELE